MGRHPFGEKFVKFDDWNPVAWKFSCGYVDIFLNFATDAARDSSYLLFATLG